MLAMRGGDDATGNLRQLVWNADGKVSGLPFCVQKAWTQYQSMVSKEKAASANYIHMIIESTPYKFSNKIYPNLSIT